MQPWVRKEVIGDCTLYQGDALRVGPMIEYTDAVVTDPPYPNSAGHFIDGIRDKKDE